jgi:hypothetical protein
VCQFTIFPPLLGRTCAPFLHFGPFRCLFSSVLPVGTPLATLVLPCLRPIPPLRSAGTAWQFIRLRSTAATSSGTRYRPGPVSAAAGALWLDGGPISVLRCSYRLLACLSVESTGCAATCGDPSEVGAFLSRQTSVFSLPVPVSFSLCSRQAFITSRNTFISSVIFSLLTLIYSFISLRFASIFSWLHFIVTSILAVLFSSGHAISDSVICSSFVVWLSNYTIESSIQCRSIQSTHFRHHRHVHGVTVDGVCIGNRVYWTLWYTQLVTSSNYSAVAISNAPQFTTVTQSALPSPIVANNVLIGLNCRI